jgi:hypothetical protein
MNDLEEIMGNHDDAATQFQGEFADFANKYLAEAVDPHDVSIFSVICYTYSSRSAEQKFDIIYTRYGPYPRRFSF